ncbi:CLUMA_CG000512, isoform A [Clunio marinus]|uniref:CLUMA_CG000512, isoform A n=1 Tax=Clunio marinus TaxID=568069 RepID=A0A1J1HFD4_9DIPT|nr:CLUMA_CG000512, isoform A [Clunio marinus]
MNHEASQVVIHNSIKKISCENWLENYYCLTTGIQDAFNCFNQSLFFIMQVVVKVINKCAKLDICFKFSILTSFPNRSQQPPPSSSLLS